MEQQFTYVVKEEILRNVLKAHNNILVVGWPGTGKTVSTLKAVGAFDDVYYYNESGPGTNLINQYNKAVKPLGVLSDFNNAKSDLPILIVDDLDKAPAPLLETIGDMISGSVPEKRKIVLIAVSLLNLKNLLPKIEVAVRLKKDTAEMIYTELLPPS